MRGNHQMNREKLMSEWMKSLEDRVVLLDVLEYERTLWANQFSIIIAESMGNYTEITINRLVESLAPRVESSLESLVDMFASRINSNLDALVERSINHTETIIMCLMKSNHTNFPKEFASARAETHSALFPKDFSALVAESISTSLSACNSTGPSNVAGGLVNANIMVMAGALVMFSNIRGIPRSLRVSGCILCLVQVICFTAGISLVDSGIPGFPTLEGYKRVCGWVGIGLTLASVVLWILVTEKYLVESTAESQDRRNARVTPTHRSSGTGISEESSVSEISTETADENRTARGTSEPSASAARTYNVR